MKLDSMQKAKVVLALNFAALFVIIILTPYFIKEGVSWATEEAAEGFFLAVELLALGFFFYQYDEIVGKKEEEAWLLDVKLKSKERELLNAFQYLGKVNVQISMVRSLLEKMRIPSTKNQLKISYAELLRLICSATGESCSSLRIIDITTSRTLSEQSEATNGDGEYCRNMKIGNYELLEKFRKNNKNFLEDFAIFFSDSKNFSIKAFIIVPNSKRSHYGREERNFLEAVANQCEIMFLLFNSRYYKSNE
jgi:hypothetical protein